MEGKERFNRRLEFKARVRMRVQAGVKDVFWRAPDRKMVKVRVKVQVKSIQNVYCIAPQVENDYPAVALRQMRSTRRRAGLSGNPAGRWTSDSPLKEDNSQD